MIKELVGRDDDMAGSCQAKFTILQRKLNEAIRHIQFLEEKPLSEEEIENIS